MVHVFSKSREEVDLVNCNQIVIEVAGIRILEVTQELTEIPCHLGYPVAETCKEHGVG